MSFVVGVLLGNELERDAGGDAAGPGLLVDGLVVEVTGGGDQGVREGGAVPGAFDELGSGGAGLDTELVLAVVEDEPVAERAGGELEVVGGGVVVGAVAGEESGRVVAAADVGQDADGFGAGGVSGFVQGEAGDHGGRDAGIGGAVGAGIANVLAGATWPDLLTIASLEAALDADLRPGRRP